MIVYTNNNKKMTNSIATFELISIKANVAIRKTIICKIKNKIINI